MNAQQFALHQGMDQGVMVDLASHSIGLCWRTCYDSSMDGNILSQGEFQEPTPSQLQCQKRCVDRFFEVYTFLGESRERREQEAHMGLPPGALSNK